MSDEQPHEGDDPMMSPEVAETPRAKRSPPKRRCKAHNRQGNQCGQAPAIGQEVCRLHGGASPQAVAKAQQRLRDASDRMAMKLLGMAESENVPAYVALQAINSALDRAGVVEPKQVDVTVGLKYESIFEAAVLESGSRSDYRAGIGRPDSPAIEPPPSRGGEHSEHQDANRLPKILATHPDGEPYIIEGVPGPPGSTHADDHHLAGESLPAEVDKSRKQSLGNSLVPVRLPHGGYLPAEEALEIANQSNRNYRYGLGKQ